MEKRKLSKSKIEGKVAKKSKNDTFSVIVKVNKANYIPSPVTLRSKINSFMFTADATSEAIENLEKDAAVLSVSVSQPIQGIK
jgi:hypothetical protein